jgi:biofilm protein TabA
MILDQLTNASLFCPLHPRFGAAFDYLRGTDFSQIVDGRYPIDGNNLFAIVQRYRTKSHDEMAWEAHRRYLDIQHVVSGCEQMGCTPLLPGMSEKTAYDEQKDLVFYHASGDLFHVPAGSFVVYMPHDLHAPGLAPGSPPLPGEVLKVVVKCRVG